jgi:VanZ family protein
MTHDCSPTSARKLLLWGLWCLTLAVWTSMLVTSQAAYAVSAVVPDDETGFWVAKSGHVAGYALLSILAGCLPIGCVGRGLCRVFLVFHAGMTEYIQLFVPDRHGSWRDVGLDIVGIMLGLVLLSLWRRLRQARPEAIAACAPGQSTAAGRTRSELHFHTSPDPQDGDRPVAAR